MEDRRADRKMLRRLRLVAVLLAILCFAGVIVKLFYMQVVKYDFYQEHLVYDKMLKRLERVYNNGKNKYKTTL